MVGSGTLTNGPHFRELETLCFRSKLKEYQLSGVKVRHRWCSCCGKSPATGYNAGDGDASLTKILNLYQADDCPAVHAKISTRAESYM